MDRARDLTPRACCRSTARISSAGWRGRAPWEWTDVAGAFAWSKLIAPAGAAYAGWHPLAAWLVTYAVFTALFALGALCQRLDVRRFVLGFTVLFAITWLAWIAGNELHLTIVDAAVDGRNRYRRGRLELGPAARRRRAVPARADRRARDRQLRERSSRRGSRTPRSPSGSSRRRSSFSASTSARRRSRRRGFAFESDSRRVPRRRSSRTCSSGRSYTRSRAACSSLQRDVSAVLASGISVCGASAAIATGGAIRAKPVIPVTVSMLVVIFAMLELHHPARPRTRPLFPDQPIVNGAALGHDREDRRRRRRGRRTARRAHDRAASAARRASNGRRVGSWHRRCSRRSGSTCSSASGRSCSR